MVITTRYVLPHTLDLAWPNNFVIQSTRDKFIYSGSPCDQY
jgi:hypothetical protein